MTCETCCDLKIADGDPKLPPFSCAIRGKEVKQPQIEQTWCPKLYPKKEVARINNFTQTNIKEMSFVDRLSIKQLEGYLKATPHRDSRKTDFDIPIIITYAQERLKKLQNVDVKTV